MKLPAVTGLCLYLCQQLSIVLSSASWNSDQQPIKTSIDEIVFVVLSQTGIAHAKQSEQFETDINEQVGFLKWRPPKIFHLHRDFPELGAWTVFPLLNKLSYYHGANNSWLFVCDEGTRVDVKKLINVFGRYDKHKEWFLGRALHDDFATIVHHFAFHENPASFKYPDFAAGFLLSFSLVKKLVPQMENYTKRLDFSIDSQHEFALFLHNEGNGTPLNDVPELCIEWSRRCASYYTLSTIPKCGDPTSSSSTFFAVKSYQQNEDRVSVLLNTWAADSTLKLKFFSDTKNTTYPVVDLGIPNTLKGHCSKTMGIINYVAEEETLDNVSWLVVADDDTLLSVPRLFKLLACYDPREQVALGQRYGFRTASQEGYDFLTGGASMVFSVATVRLLAEGCVCPTDDSPDDMLLGMCLKRMGVRLTHSPHFHQARPSDYSHEVLAHREPVSFHKFWMINPYEVYDEWLRVSRTIEDPKPPHQEL